MGAGYEAMRRHFQSEGWLAHELDGQTTLELTYEGQSGRWACYAQVREPQQQFLFYSVCSVKVPPALRPAVAEYLTRANWELVIGNLEMDWNDGDVRFKTEIEYEGDWPATGLVQRAVYANVLMMERYLPGLMAVIYGKVDAATALQQADGERPA